jgi:hypothetical protein
MHGITALDCPQTTQDSICGDVLSCPIKDDAMADVCWRSMVLLP